ncbi:type IV pilin N-terminal domain-containing protein [Haloferax sp. S1W]|uniref:type IV pilin N-terminal domain-containing protein n=1 Tax=Haloferax sp. S1W TaxID=3377110 RepID=UPI0037CAF4AC
MSLRTRFSNLSTVGKVIVLVVVLAGLLFALVGAVFGTAIVGTFVLGMGENVEQSPEASFTSSVSDGTVRIEHLGGESISATELTVVVGEREQSWASLADGDGSVEQGDSVSVSASDGESVRLVYTGGERNTTLVQFTA